MHVLVSVLLLLLSCCRRGSSLVIDCEESCTPCSDTKCSQLLSTHRECPDEYLPLDCQDCERVPQHFCSSNTFCPRETNWNTSIRYTFKYRDRDHLYVELEWDTDPDIPLYTLLVSHSTNVAEICSGERLVEAAQMTSGNVTYRLSVRYHKADGTYQHIHVVLLPSRHCGGPKVTIPIPQDCFSLCPGMHSCHAAPIRRPQIIATSHLCLNDNTSVVNVSWVPGVENWYSPYNRTFLLTLKSTGAPQTVAVVGKTDVSILVQENTSYKLWIREYRGGSPTDENIPTCSIPSTIPPTTTAPPTTAPMTTDPPTTTMTTDPPTTIPTTTALPITTPMTTDSPTATAKTTAPSTTTPMTTDLPTATIAPHLSAATLANESVSEPNTFSLATPGPSNTTDSPQTTPSAVTPNTVSLTAPGPSNTTDSPRTTPSAVTPNTVSLTTPGPSNTTDSPRTTPSTVTPIFYIIPVFATLVPVIIILTIVIILRKVQRKPNNKQNLKDGISPDETKVLLLYSPANSQRDVECILENFVKELHEYGIHSVFYQNSSMKGCVADWVNTNVKTCRKIFLVCNQQFAKEWVEPTADPLCGNSVVYVLRQVVDSYVKNDKRQLEKFAVLYLRKKDQNCLDYPFTRNMKSFLVNPQDLEQIVSFIHDLPIYKLA